MSEGDVTRKKKKKETYHDYNTSLKLNKVKSQFQIFKDTTFSTTLVVWRTLLYSLIFYKGRESIIES
jgi:hypothetical protein